MADLQRRRQEILEEINRFDMSYVYHHSLDRRPNTTSVACGHGAGGGYAVSVGHKTGTAGDIGHRKTAAQEKKDKLEMELADVKDRLRKLKQKGRRQ